MPAVESAFNGRALDGRVAVVSGGGRGIGRAIAQRYAAEGATVVISARTTTDLDAVVDGIAELGGRALAVTADATTPAGARLPVERAIAEYGRIDVLVNNVGGTLGKGHDPFAAEGDGFERTLDLDLDLGVVGVHRRAAHDARAGSRLDHLHRVEERAIRAARRRRLRGRQARHGRPQPRPWPPRPAVSGIRVDVVSPGWSRRLPRRLRARMAERAGTTPEEARASAEGESAPRRQQCSRPRS